jgi:hypothetical protein
MALWNRIFRSSLRPGSPQTSGTELPMDALSARSAQKPGADCPFFAAEICSVGGGHLGGGRNLCSLGRGHYWSDCHVYSTTGLKGQYDREKVEAASRRAQLKNCNRCGVALQISEHLDFRYAIGEFASESDFRLAGQASGVSCSSCHADYCHKCMLAFGQRHPSSGGLGCLKCAGRMTQFDP